MRALTTIGLAVGVMVGLWGGYYLMRPFMESTRARETVLKYETPSVVILRGEVVHVDLPGKTVTIRASFPGSPDVTAPIRIPLGAVQNFLNLDLHKGRTGENVRDGRDDILTIQEGKLVTLRLLRRPGPFTVLSLSVTSPITERI